MRHTTFLKICRLRCWRQSCYSVSLLSPCSFIVLLYAVVVVVVRYYRKPVNCGLCHCVGCRLTWNPWPLLSEYEELTVQHPINSADLMNITVACFATVTVYHLPSRRHRRYIAIALSMTSKKNNNNTRGRAGNWYYRHRKLFVYISYKCKKNCSLYTC